MTPSGPETRQLVVTGCYRSGTTLLEKLLHAHPDISVGAQAFPTLFSHGLDEFHRSRGLERRYPLGHLFGESDYTPDEVARFLDDLVLDDEAIDEIFRALPTGDVRYDSDGLVGHRGEIRPGRFCDVLRELSDCVARMHAKEAARLTGTKEIVCEVVLPLLVKRGQAGVIIVRDPRQVIASAHFGERGKYLGRQRPVLSTIRAWRKSVAFVIELEGRPGFGWLRYEDLLASPAEALSRVTESVGQAPYPVDRLTAPILDQRGEVWSANSSFEPGEARAFGIRHDAERALPEPVAAYVEMLCEPEMKLLGYEPRVAQGFDPATVSAYRDPFEVTHPAFEPDYSSTPGRVEQEIERWRALGGDPARDVDARRLFIFPRCYSVLRASSPSTRP